MQSRVRARMEGLRQHLESARVPLGAGGRAMLSRLAGACEIEPEVCKFQRPVRAWACRLWVGSDAEAQGVHRRHGGPSLEPVSAGVGGLRASLRPQTHHNCGFPQLRFHSYLPTTLDYLIQGTF